MSYTDKLKVELYDEVVNEKNKQYIELSCRFRETCNDIKKKDKEIERLNNIPNELEKWLVEWREMLDCPDFYEEGIIDCINDTLTKLQELKGDDKE